MRLKINDRVRLNPDSRFNSSPWVADSNPGKSYSFLTGSVIYIGGKNYPEELNIGVYLDNGLSNSYAEEDLFVVNTQEENEIFKMMSGVNE